MALELCWRRRWIWNN